VATTAFGIVTADMWTWQVKADGMVPVMVCGEDKPELWWTDHIKFIVLTFNPVVTSSPGLSSTTII
jgi:hypothetical protein